MDDGRNGGQNHSLAKRIGGEARLVSGSDQNTNGLLGRCATHKTGAVPIETRVRFYERRRDRGRFPGCVPG
jgi:hypothetical protein